jgi:hypothetical protein
MYDEATEVTSVNIVARRAASDANSWWRAASERRRMRPQISSSQFAFMDTW